MKALVSFLLILSVSGACFGGEKPSMAVGTYKQEVCVRYGAAEGFAANEANAIAVSAGGAVYAGTPSGLYILEDGKWNLLEMSRGYNIEFLAATSTGSVLAVAEGGVYEIDGLYGFEAGEVPSGITVTCLASCGPDIYLGSMQGLYMLEGNAFKPVEEANALLGSSQAIRAVAGDRKIAVAALEGLLISEDGEWRREYPRDGARSWAPYDVRGVAQDRDGRVWFASAQGVGCMRGDRWHLFTAEDGLPYDDFTTVAAGERGAVWFGTNIGAIKFDGSHWAYRQGLRWLPHDVVRGIATNENGDAFFATPGGVWAIERREMRLAEKAEFYIDEIDKYNRRTPFGYVLDARLKNPGDKSETYVHDSDNDGLWTSMYGAGECYAWAATKDPKAKERARNAFEALRFLRVVTQGGEPPARPGFVARTILPTSGENPNEHRYTRENDERSRANNDSKWKVMAPRWPTSACGEWYWKSDTSSDELDGHYWFYGLYYDLVIDTEEEKERVREHVASMTDHLLANNFALVDWDGEQTRWAVFGPDDLNFDPTWFVERGLNSLSMLTYLATTGHITGEQKYYDAMDKLIDEHGYAINIMYPKLQFGPGSMNQSDDEMAFMNYYNLLKYAKDPSLRQLASLSFFQYWLLEKPELNPLFNFMYAASDVDPVYKGTHGDLDMRPKGDWLAQSVDTLKRFPLDRCNWAHINSHRKDIVPLPHFTREGDDARGRGFRNNGYVLPVDERHFNHWNTDPWQLNYGGNGTTLSDGAVFLTPYYMGLYYGFITE